MQPRRSEVRHRKGDTICPKRKMEKKGRNSTDSFDPPATTHNKIYPKQNIMDLLTCYGDSGFRSCISMLVVGCATVSSGIWGPHTRNNQLVEANFRCILLDLYVATVFLDFCSIFIAASESSLLIWKSPMFTRLTKWLLDWGFPWPWPWIGGKFPPVTQYLSSWRQKLGHRCLSSHQQWL